MALRIFKRFVELFDAPAPADGKVLGWSGTSLANLNAPTSSSILGLIDVRTLGVVCDGVTDDTAAWNALISTYGGGDNVAFLVPGRSVVDGGVLFPANIHLISFGVRGGVFIVGGEGNVGFDDGSALCTVRGDEVRITWGSNSQYETRVLGGSVTVNGPDGALGLSPGSITQYPSEGYLATNIAAPGWFFNALGINSGLGHGDIAGQLVYSLTWNSVGVSGEIPANSSADFIAPIEGHEVGDVACVPTFDRLEDGLVGTAFFDKYNRRTVVRITNTTACPITVSTQSVYVITFSRYVPGELSDPVVARPAQVPTPYTTATLPTAALQWVGKTVYVKDVGVAGKFYGCRETAVDNTFEWVNLTP